MLGGFLSILLDLKGGLGHAHLFALSRSLSECNSIAS
jgi:hypothetical protein